MTEQRCERCGSELHERFARLPTRWLRLECDECEWAGEPYQPFDHTVITSRKIMVDFGGFSFKGYDQYNVPFIISRSYDTEEECLAEAKHEYTKMCGKSGYATITIVMWPPYVTVTGKIINTQDAPLVPE